MNRIVSVTKMYLRDKLSWIYMPWIILLFNLIIHLTIRFSIGAKDGMYSGGITSLYVYTLVIGIIALPQTFVFALGLGVRRKDYFAGTAMNFTLISLGTSILILLFSLLEGWSGGWGVGLHFFRMPNWGDGTVIGQVTRNFVLMLHLFFLGFVISSVQRRYGWFGMIVLSGVVFAGVSILVFSLSYYQWWGALFQWIAGITVSEWTGWLFALMVVYALASYTMLRKAAV
ncbi:hypothetical protein SAMN04487970_100194 [Paenibacillus tianmuensis]|uniref:ABC-2 type transport system permease protein n=1 Tax=Paenibacillus tianmuensis TaxID=624147 RepID=A0A1G4P5C8_9BACL|nr:hypothetical protein [Paenibacillus tianmuensis]SCW27434.1 hypothetical protein SAMN04487970_100194 [Paenibacillus tianmuensis]